MKNIISIFVIVSVVLAATVFYATYYGNNSSSVLKAPASHLPMVSSSSSSSPPSSSSHSSSFSSSTPEQPSQSVTDHVQQNLISPASELNEKLSTAGASWSAGENEFTGMTLSDFTRKIIPKSVADSIRAQYMGVHIPSEPIQTSLPLEFDWRNYNGKNWVTSVKHQGNCGSCWAFSAVAQLESRYNILFNNPDENFDLSEQQVMTCSFLEYWDTNGCEGGSPAWVAMNIDRYGGITDERSFPYMANNSPAWNSKYYRCDQIKNPEWSPKYKIGIWYMGNMTKDEIKDNIIRYGPMTTMFDVPSDFPTYKSGIYENTTNDYLGGHAAVIVGWGNKDGRDYWIAKNSWGLKWGEQGYFRIWEGVQRFASDLNLIINVTSIDTTMSCNDSDNGLEYEIAGYVDGKAYGNNYNLTDICSSSNVLKEYNCKTDGSFGFVSITCPYGCDNSNSSGSCISLSVIQNYTCSAGQKVGDTNGDGLVDNKDANIILQIAAALKPTPENICCADADKNGKIQAYDASLVLQGNVSETCQ